MLDPRARARVNGSGATGGLGWPLRSSLPEDQCEGSSGLSAMHLPAATPGREQVLLLPDHGSQESCRACLHTVFCDTFHMEKPQVSLSNQSGKIPCISADLRRCPIVRAEGTRGRDGEIHKDRSL